MIKNIPATGPPSTSPRTSCFLGCFGYSGDKMQLVDQVNSTSRHRRRWISKWSFSCKKSKTVNQIKAVKLEQEQDATLTKKHVTSEEQKTSRKKWTDIVKRQNSRKETKPVAKTANGSGVESPKKKTVTIVHPFVSTPLKPIHSKTLPPPKRQKPPKAPLAGGGVDELVLGHKTKRSGGEFDSIIAMTILLVILVIMVLWGKLCAIFCSCAWFLVAPRLVPVGEHSERRRPESETNLDMESVEYKKKVVLEGLLQRNHRNVVVGR